MSNQLEKILSLINGSIFSAYLYCKREAWLCFRQIEPDQNNYYIVTGRMIDEHAYSRKKKNIAVENISIDFIERKNYKPIIAEVKRSSCELKKSELQLKYYLYRLFRNKIYVEGVLLIPKEKKMISVTLNSEDIKMIERLVYEIYQVITCSTIPPLPDSRQKCNKCSYFEFCWV